ncbi:MAG: matrixin family metalloprotease [Gammaproteobacteria bacterium]|nr:matrixin family metalloprotease [Gammaproteobacteria bacterium]MBT3859287.1 matrixin family metalloprotease [Gammaproteobacteria bacterium]MBT3987977.1 matrixin family metalloprotease [Gammaproteobacteria bacterium]MBT4583066.1 matrixin family metalloprotease [Gammaproteobacteria bacterium]MBT4658031.1 matrixin family metalloprotease [Gammaproteobacteria bacterium]
MSRTLPFAFLFLFLLIAPMAQSYEISENFWESGSATFHVGISGNSPSGESWKSAFTRAMDSWSDATAFQFFAVDDYIDPCNDRGNDLFGDDITGIDFTSTICGTEFNENVLAVTLTAGVCINTECTGGFFISDADIVFNEAEPWDVYTGPLRFDNTIDFQRVALHELGHALGLNHEEDEVAIMQALVTDFDILQQDDINGANFIYGSESSQSTVHGIDVILPQNSSLSGPSNSLNFSGNLSSSDAKFDNKFLDLYQYTFENDSEVDIQLDSSELNPFLYLARISSTQDILADWLFTDDNSGSGTNARVTADIQAGTYWIGVSSGSDNEEGSYSVSLDSSSSGQENTFAKVPSGFGLDVEINPNPNISGGLSQVDFVFEGKFIDLYQFDVINPTNLRIDLRSSEFDTHLMLVDVLPGNVLGNIFLQNDDVTDGNSDSRLEQTLQQGTYWIGVTSFSNGEVGDYSITSTVIIP